MILTVDIGNTQTKLGAWDNHNLVFVARLQTSTRRTSDEYAIDLMDILRLNRCNSSQFDGAIIASVVPAVSAAVRDAVELVLRVDTIFLVSPGLKTGLNIKIDTPSTLGADMVCAAVAAIDQYPLPCIIISMGTATAIFVVDKDGSFLGGSVSAGVGISLEALSLRTAQLPHISLDNPPAGPIGSNTVDCIRSGIIYGTADMVDGMVNRMRKVVGEEATAIACGGNAENIICHCSSGVELNPNLVLEGLRLIYYKNAR